MGRFPLAIAAMGVATLLPGMLALRRSRELLSGPVLVGAFFSYFFFFMPLDILFHRGQGLFYGDAPYTLGLLVAFTALLAFYLGWFVPQARFRSRPGRSRRHAPSLLFQIGFLLWIAGFLGRVGFIVLTGGWANFFSRQHFLATREVYVTAYVYDLWRLVFAGIILMLQASLPRTRSGWLAPRALATIGVSLVVLAMAIATGSRQDTFYLLASWIVVTSLSRARRPSRKFVAACLLAAGMAPLLLLTYRTYIHLGPHAPSTRTRVFSTYMTKKVMNPSTGNEFVNETALVTSCFDLGQYDYGRGIAYIPVNFVPRPLWPGKPYHLFRVSPVDLISRRWGWEPARGFVITGPGSVFFEFGFAGVGLWFALGVIARRLYNRAVTSDAFAVACYAALACVLFQFVAQDVFVGILNAMFLFAPLALAYKVSRVNTRSRLPMRRGFPVAPPGVAAP